MSFIAAGRAFTTPKYQNTLPIYSKLPYATFIPTLVCPVGPLEGPRGPNEPKIVFLGAPPSDITVVYH